jgi:hypothetical protein
MDITGELLHANDEAEESTEKKPIKSIPFAGSELGELRHVCAFFNSDDEEYNVLLPFIKDGFACGDKAVHIINPGQRANHLHQLTMAGINPDEAEQRGQLELRINTETYLQEGHFDQDRMLSVFEQLAGGTAGGEYPRSRIVCRMDWASGSAAEIENIVEFEARVNELWLRHEDAVICTYHLGKFGGETVIDIMRTHPAIIIGGILRHNPFYVPPAEFLSELRTRQK